MISITSISLAIFGIFFFLYIIRLVTKKKLLLSYSLLWILLSFIVIAFALFPAPLFWLAGLFGIELPSNFVFIIAIICLLAISLSLSIIASKQTAYSKTLIQEVAILKKDLEEIKKYEHQH